MSEIRQANPLPVPDSEALRFLPEGPVALGDNQCSWVGIQHGKTATFGSLNLYDLLTGENRSFDLPGRPGFAFACETPDLFIVGCERDLGFFNTATKTWQPLKEGVDSDVDNTIINDGIVVGNNLVFGTKDLEFATKKAGLYLFRGSDQKLIRLRDDQICSNGKAVVQGSDGGLRLLDIDTPTRQLVSYPFDIENAELGQPEVVLDFHGEAGLPDGAILTPDNSGVIVAMFRPEAAEFGETRHYDLATGELRCTWQTPGSPQNTCPALVRHDGKLKLLITTAVENMSDEDQRSCPNAGRLFLGEVSFQDDGRALGVRFPA